MEPTNIPGHSPTVPTRLVEFNLDVVPDHPASVSGYADTTRLQKTALLHKR